VVSASDAVNDNKDNSHGSREAFGVRRIPALSIGVSDIQETAPGCGALQTLREIRGLRLEGLCEISGPSRFSSLGREFGIHEIPLIAFQQFLWIIFHQVNPCLDFLLFVRAKTSDMRVAVEANVHSFE